MSPRGLKFEFFIQALATLSPVSLIEKLFSERFSGVKKSTTGPFRIRTVFGPPGVKDELFQRLCMPRSI
jgi:hypothetical protein